MLNRRAMRATGSSMRVMAPPHNLKAGLFSGSTFVCTGSGSDEVGVEMIAGISLGIGF